MMRSKESLSVAPAVATILKQIEDGARPTAVCVMRARAAGAHGGINFPTPGLDEDAPDVVVTQVDSVLATDLRCARAALESMSGAARAVVLDLGLRVVWAQALQRGRALALERCIPDEEDELHVRAVSSAIQTTGCGGLAWIALEAIEDALGGTPTMFESADVFVSDVVSAWADANGFQHTAVTEMARELLDRTEPSAQQGLSP